MPNNNKNKKAWLPTDNIKMRFMKILNIEYYDESVSKTVYDVNVLQEVDTGEILLNIYKRGNTLILGNKLLDKNVGISTLHHEIRNNIRHWTSKKMDIFEFKHIGNAEVNFPKMQEGVEISQKEEEVNVKKIPVKERKEHTNSTVGLSENEKPKPKRKRKSNVKSSSKVDSKSKNTPKASSKPETTKTTKSKSKNAPTKATTKKQSTKRKSTTRKKNTKKKTPSKSKNLF